MAVIPNSTIAPFGAVTILRLVTLAERAFEPLVRWNKARQIGDALSRLSPRQLDDIGLIPGDIGRIADDLARR